jgi:hypothetical protein
MKINTSKMGRLVELVFAEEETPVAPILIPDNSQPEQYPSTFPEPQSEKEESDAVAKLESSRFNGRYRTGQPRWNDEIVNLGYSQRTFDVWRNVLTIWGHGPADIRPLREFEKWLSVQTKNSGSQVKDKKAEYN